MEAFSVVNDELSLVLYDISLEREGGASQLVSTENISKRVRSLIPIDDLRKTGAFLMERGYS